MNILEQIVTMTQKRLLKKKAALPLDSLKKQKMPQREPFIFQKALSKDNIAFICEVKKASPSKGIIDESFPYVEIAREYEKAGADAVSVLTEPDFFMGDTAYLEQIRQHINIPILCKDFIIDPYQIYEAKNAGADAVLLICAILNAHSLKEYIDLAHALGMSALVEIHDERELLMALKCGAKVIGANNRDLKTFNVDTDTSIRLRRLAPASTIFISESGIKTRANIIKLEQSQINGVLVGETLMCSTNKQAALNELRGITI